MLDGNVLLRQECDEVPKGTLSCPDRNLADFHHYRHYEGLRLLPSVCDSKLIQQTIVSELLYDNQKTWLIRIMVHLHHIGTKSSYSCIFGNCRNSYNSLCRGCC